MRRLIAFAILAHLSVFAATEKSAEDLYIVVLEQPAVVEKVLEWSSGQPLAARKRILHGPSARRSRTEVEADQERLVGTLARGHGLAGKSETTRPLQVLGRGSFLLNRLVIRADGAEVKRLRARPEVRGVYPNGERWLLLDEAPNQVGAPVLWELLGEGKEGAGSRIAILDSGINHRHPMFQNDSLPATEVFPDNQTAYTNRKVIVARNYARAEFGLSDGDLTAEDRIGHGSRVAAIAAGSPVNSPAGRIQGLAPQAYLGNYRVFGQESRTTTAAVIAAIKEAVEDRMDVLNLSLGGDADDPGAELEAMAIALATQAGAVVVAASGNSGPDLRSITTPGISSEAITVGATTHSRFLADASLLEISASRPLPPELRSIPSIPGEGIRIEEDQGPFDLVSIAGLDPIEEACSQLPPGSLDGRAVLVRRGNCFFSTKLGNVSGAGAAALIVYNNEDGGPIIMAGLGSAEIPAVMIEKQRGETLDELLLGVVQIDVVIAIPEGVVAFPSEPDIVTGFSGRGPNPDLKIKPDLVGPGLGIYTASNQVDPEPGFFPNASGTSFSTPIVSGAAALLTNLYPDWPPWAIKSALVNTASKVTTWNDEPARVMHTGNGRLALQNTLNLATALDPPSLSFGLQGANPSGTLTRTVKVANLGLSPQVLEVELVERFENPSVQLSVSPSNLPLPPLETRELQVVIRYIHPLRPGTFEGFIQLWNPDTNAVLTASYWGGVTVEDHTQLLEVSQQNGSAFVDLAAAVAKARPGNVIEITDSATYTTNLQLHFNEEGLPLHGLTVRARRGETPTLQPAVGSNAVITVTNLRDITLERLRFRRASGAIRFRNSTGIIRDNSIEGLQEDSSAYGIRLENSRAHIMGNDVFGGGGFGLRLSSSDALVQKYVPGPW